MVSDAAGEPVKVQDIASMLSRLSNEEKCNLGYFIRKTPQGNAFLYSMVDEFLALNEDQAYGLTLKTGKNFYPFDQALTDFPDLGKYVENPIKKPRRKVKRRAKKAKAVQPVAKKTAAPAAAEIKVAAGPEPEPAVPAESDTFTESLERIFNALLQISEQGGLNINVNVSVKFEGFGE
ncbi:hypothetical protein DENIS_3510 [Desulfonema ishimotonii]|uniref:Uncharacterized protein n=2 Tax=Desulfonema ishimotonii TaxID=45657 RepID=A0A401FZZ8_9BACT|nr:hypothetical protein DENIS_3510 [Desulfonema ishimotonii]